ncbi:MAG TPA: APC family permease [Candidatus Acidoferrales bacterium]|nr:APC family permease [Candidatus Acidoferrales bacterium]
MAERARVEMKKTLGLTGVTVNAMALIAPGAFLWITYQLQAAQTLPGSGDSTSLDILPGILFALLLAFLTALSYSELAHLYPDAGTGSAYYFAHRSFVDKANKAHHRWARPARLLTGWAAHLFYWVYSGVMVSMMAILVAFVLGQFGLDVGVVGEAFIALLFAALVGVIAVRGITGSTTTALVINVIQLTTLVGFSAVAIAYRLLNPDGATFAHTSAASVVLPHSFFGMLAQSTIAILILVGFESATAFGAEAKNARRDIPRAVILALVIQGLFAYVIEYFAAGFAVSDKLTGTAADGSALTGLSAAAASSAPIGDLIRQIGDTMLGGLGFPIMIVVAVTVALAILGTTLSSVNTGVRITFAMAQDQEMPGPLGFLHGRYATPHMAVMIMTVFIAIIGVVGVLSVVTLTGITLASNFGTFVLYALTCLFTFNAFIGRADFNVLKHAVIPLLGLVANVLMLVTIFAMGFAGGGDPQTESFIALGIAALWAIASSAYIFRNRKTRVVATTTERAAV